MGGSALSDREPSPPPRDISIFPVLLVNFIGSLGFSIVLPFLVFVVAELGGNAVIYGLLGATYPAFQLIGGPILGRWSDRIGRRDVLLLSQFGTFLSWGAFALALIIPVTVVTSVTDSALGTFTLTIPLLLLFAARAFDGLTGGNISVANAYIADITPETERSARFGKMGASASLGYVVGPALAGLLGATQFEHLLPVLAAMGISLVATAVVALFLPESRSCVFTAPPPSTDMGKVLGQELKACTTIEGKEDFGLRDALRIRHVPWMLLLYFTAFVGFTLFHAAFPMHAIGELGWSVAQTGAFFTVLALAMVIVEGPVMGWLTNKLPNRTMMVAGSVVLATGLFSFTSSADIAVYGGAVLYATGTGLLWPPLLAVIANIAGEEHQGAVQGVVGSAGSLASIIGLVLGGILYEWVSSTTFIVAAAAIVLVAGMSTRVTRFENTS